MPEHNALDRTVTERVLVADDSLVIRKAIEKHLKADFDVVLADNGETAWEIVTRDPAIKVLITDIEMPRLDGYGLICRIRAADEVQVRGMPVIAITGAEDEQTKARAFACGATDFIIKPIDPMQLHARVHAHVKFTDASRRLAQAEAALEDESVNDPLTRLCGRRYFRRRAEQELAHAVRHGGDFLLARLDVDRMKQIYAQHGDDLVDALLVWLAERLKRVSRNEDTVARIGGAEFAVLALTTGQESGEVVCNRIRAAVVAEPFCHGKETVRVTLSIGLVTLDEDRLRSLDDILALAERRLVHAKSEGGDRVSTTTQGSDLVPPEELALAAAEPPLPVEELLNVADAATLPLAEIEDLCVPQEDGSNVPSPAIVPAAPAEDLADLLSIDRALMMLVKDDIRRLEPWIDGVALRVLPLLEFCNRRRGLGLDQALADIKSRLASRD
ncbi:MAG: diguanylate cyclase [Gammaproteobacteria bacterium]|nr:diguanylate cyclase [Gammaproteobacteria bacterium]